MSHHVKGSSKKKSETRMAPEEDPEFQIAPMIDILLVLLVFFMTISSTEVLQTNDAVHLPVAKDAKDKNGAKQAGAGQVIINVLWSSVNAGVTGTGTLDIDGKTYPTADAVGEVLKTKAAAAGADFRVVIRADKEVRYEFLRGLLRAAGNAGVSNVTFSVVSKDDGKAPPKL